MEGDPFDDPHRRAKNRQSTLRVERLKSACDMGTAERGDGTSIPISVGKQVARMRDGASTRKRAEVVTQGALSKESSHAVRVWGERENYNAGAKGTKSEQMTTSDYALTVCTALSETDK